MKQKTGRKLLSFILTLAMVVGLMPGMSLTALAATNTYTNLIPTDSDTDLSAKQVTFNGIDWYVIKDESTAADAGTVTLFAKDPLSASEFDKGTPKGNGYTGANNKYSSATRSSTVKGELDALTAEGGSFEDVAYVIQSVDLTDVDVTGAKLWLLSVDEASALPVNIRKCAQASGAGGNVFWLRSPGNDTQNAVGVFAENGNVIVNGYMVAIKYGVRPALKLDLSKVTFDSATNTFSLAPVSYRAASVNAETHEVTFTDASCAEYTVVSANTTAFEDGKWYVVTTSKDITQRITVSGTANLILVDGKILTATKGITVTTGNALNIYAQSEDDAMGQIIINGVESPNAGIGANSAGGKGGNITINGGNINVTGGTSSAGIGGGMTGGDGGELTINGGIVTAVGGSNAAGIGGGSTGGEGGELTINGGIVTAVGGSNAAGIGGGGSSRSKPGGKGGTVTINGGTVNATGGDGAMGIGGGKGNSDHGTLTLGTGMWILVSTDNTNWSAYDGSTRTRFMKTYPHTHDFTYSADGATITATCGAEDCGLTDSKTTLTIVAPTMTVYQETGKSEVASLTGLQDFNTATGKSLAVTNIMYVGRDGTEYTESTTAPTNAGKYTATITLSGVKTAEGDDKSVAASVDYSIKYAVTFNTNGGSTVPQQLVEAGESATRPTDPTKEGNIFGGWFADADFAERYVFDEVTENTTVYAKWGEHRVTWTVGEFSNQDVFTGNAPAAVSNTTVNLAAETFKPDGATLSWKTETDVSGDVTHTAQFSFPVTLNVNGGTINAGNVESYIYGTGATLPTDVTRAKYDFGGWYANSELTGTAVTQIGTTATGSKEFWAKWTAVYAVPATVTANNRTYDGTEKPLVTVTGTATGGEMQYALGTETEATQPYTATIPSKTDAGTYYVWYKVVGDENHNDAAGSFTVTVDKADQTAPAAPTKASATINSITLTATDGYQYKCGDGDWQDSAVFTGLTMNTEYTFYQRVAGDDNHNDSPDSQSATISTNNHAHEWSYAAGTGENANTITATCADTDGGHGETKTATLIIVAPTLTTYGGTGDATATLTGSIDGVTNPDIVYKKGTETLNAAPTDAGTYTASITLGEGEGAATASVGYTVAKAAQTAVPSGVTISTIGVESVFLSGVDGEEYIVVPKGTETLDWTAAQTKDEYGTVAFIDVLNEATEYTACARIAETDNYLPGEAVTQDFATQLSSFGGSGYLIVGGTMQASVDIEVEGIAFQWYRDGEAIDGATADSYTIQETDAGKKIGVRPFKNNQPLWDEIHDFDEAYYGTVNIYKEYNEDEEKLELIRSVENLKYGDTVQAPETPTKSGYIFAGWVSYFFGEFETETFPLTVEGNLNVYARWTQPSSGGSSTTTVTVPVTSDTTTGSVPVKASVSGTTATVTKLTDEQLAQVTTNKSGNKDAGAETETNSVVIDVSGVAKDVKTATIPTETVKAVEETGSNLKVTLTDGSVEFDAAAQATITDEAKGATIQINLDAVKVTTLTSAQQSAVESLEVEVVLDAYVTSNGQRISDFKGGSATLSVPYTLKDGQAAQGIVVWYVASDGTRTQVDASYDGKNVVFSVPHFSNYVIAYDAEKAAACPQDKTCPISKFADASATAWYHDGVHWALESGVMNGVGDGKFAPNDTTTRAQVVTMLWRLEGSPAYVGMSEFSDVDNEQWYGPAIRWASAEGIVNGYDDGKFGPNDPVTREQLVTILYRYAQYKKLDVSVGEDTNILSYDDAFDVHQWAMSAMQWACGSGIVNGIDKNGTLMLAPSDASTRAVVATMFWRFSK